MYVAMIRQTGQSRSTFSTMTTVCGTVLLVCLVGSVWSQCANNWLVHDNSCYHFSHDEESWPDAQAVCRLFDAHLVEINNAVEERFIANNLKVNAAWIGLNDLEEEGIWIWIGSGSSPQFTDWHPGEPNNSGDNENCALAFQSDWGWNDGSCKSPFHYVCEKEMSGETVVVG